MSDAYHHLQALFIFSSLVYFTSFASSFMEDISIGLFISLVEDRPVIWDKTLEIYKDKTLKQTAWREICVILKENFEEMEQKDKQNFGKEILKKWTNIRDSWSRALKKNKVQRTSGSSRQPARLYVYHEQMSFLKKITDSTVPHESTQNDEIANEPTKETVDAEINIASTKNTSTTKRKRAINEMDAKMMKFLDHQMHSSTVSSVHDENRHLSFFKSLLPSLSSLDDDNTLEFQSGVLRLLQNVKAKMQRSFDNHPPLRTAANSHNHNWNAHQPTHQQRVTTATPSLSPYISEPSPTPSIQSVSSRGSYTQSSIQDFDYSNF